MELADSTLKDIIDDKEVIEEDTILKHLYQALLGYKSLRNYNIFHQDIKPGNLLFKDDHIKITDFGVSKIIPHD